MMQRLGTSIIAILILGATAFTQEKASPLSNYQYKIDYSQYEDVIKKEPDAQKRCNLLLDFLKQRPISRILYYVVADYMNCVKPVIDKRDYPKAIAMEEALWTLLPTDKTIQEAGIPPTAPQPAGEEEFRRTQLAPSQILIQKSIAGIYLQAKNLPKAAEAAEKLYALTQDKEQFFALAAIYYEMQNYDKYLDYGKKILAAFPMDKACPIAIQMAEVYFTKQNPDAAMDLYSKIESSFGDKTPPNVPEAQYNAIRTRVYFKKANGLFSQKNYPKAREFFEKVIQLDPKNDAANYYIAACTYEQKDYPKALELFQKVVQADPKNDAAYYYIAMSKWQDKDTEGALAPFAKCVVLNKSAAKTCREFLEKLYKARNKDSIDGLDKILAKAKTDLGIN
jgi:tetratricopeptide (TPR) repeat protein